MGDARRSVRPERSTKKTRAFDLPVILISSACARNGVHYVDLTGEAYWIRDIINKSV